MFINLNPTCEPQLGKRELYSAIGGQGDKRQVEQAMLRVLNLSDGHHSLLDVAVRSGLPFDVIAGAASSLIEHELLEQVSPQVGTGRLQANRDTPAIEANSGAPRR